MTQRIFDTNNAEDMKLLWSILPDECMRIVTRNGILETCHGETIYYNNIDFKHIIKINWRGKTEIKRIQEATKADVGKLCVFWNDENRIRYGVLTYIGYSREMPYYATNVDEGSTFNHCRRLTKQEIEELC